MQKVSRENIVYAMSAPQIEPGMQVLFETEDTLHCMGKLNPKAAKALAVRRICAFAITAFHNIAPF